MSRFGYVWVLVSVALALGVASYESHARDVAIRDATHDALYVGLKAGCDRDVILGQGGGLTLADCSVLAKRIADNYSLQAGP